MKYDTEINNSYHRGITGTATEDDGLSRMVWRTYYEHKHNALKVDYYAFEQRQTKRHGWNKTAFYIGGPDQRKNTITTPPPPPPELCDKMLAAFVSGLTVKW